MNNIDCEKLHTVLYLDDDTEQLALLRVLLESRFDVIVDIATCAAAAEEFLNKRCYDLIISDVNLPGRLGTEIARKIKENNSEQPILIITAYMSERVKKDCNRYKLELMPKFSSGQIDVFLNRIGEILNSDYCKLKRDRVPDHRLHLISPHVKALEDQLGETLIHPPKSQSKDA